MIKTWFQIRVLVEVASHDRKILRKRTKFVELLLRHEVACTQHVLHFIRHQHALQSIQIVM